MALARSVEHPTRSRDPEILGEARVLPREVPVDPLPAEFGQTTEVRAHQAVPVEDGLAAQAALADRMVQMVRVARMGQAGRMVRVDQTVLAVPAGQTVLAVREDQTDPLGVPEDQEVQADPEVISVLTWPKWLSIKSSIWSC